MPDLEFQKRLPSLKRIIQITVMNNKSSATANPHIQEIVIPHTYLEALLGFELYLYSAPLFIYFYDPNQNSELYSWYETYDGTYHHWWVKLPQISADSSYSIYMIYDSSQIQLDGDYVGISPDFAYYINNIVDSYGQYDNGTNVFYYYWNFSGTSLPSGFSTYGSVSVNNKLILSVNNSWAYIYASISSLPSTGIMSRVHWMALSNTGEIKNFWGYGVTGSSTLDNYYGYYLIDQSAGSVLLSYAKAGWYSIASTGWSESLYTYYMSTGYWYGNYLMTKVFGMLTGSPNITLGPVYNTTYSLSQVQQHALSWQSGTSSTMYAFVYAIMDAPPNGIMPTYLFKPIS